MVVRTRPDLDRMVGSDGWIGWLAAATSRSLSANAAAPSGLCRSGGGRRGGSEGYLVPVLTLTACTVARGIGRRSCLQIIASTGQLCQSVLPQSQCG